MHHPTYRIAHTTVFVTQVEEYWLDQEIAQWVHPMKDRSERSYNGATSRSFATGSLIIISVVSVSKPAILSRAIGTPSVLQMYQANVCELIQMIFRNKQKVI